MSTRYIFEVIIEREKDGEVIHEQQVLEGSCVGSVARYVDDYLVGLEAEVLSIRRCAAIVGRVPEPSSGQREG